MSSPLATSLAFGQHIIIRYVQSSIFTFGIIGSLMNIALFSRRKLQNNSCCTYFFFASFSAIILLSMGIIPLLYADFNSPNPFTTIPAFCKTRIYVNQLSAMSCRWLLVMACIDRCLTCSMHAQIRHVFTVKTSCQSAVGLIFIWMIIPIHTLIFGNIVPPGNIACVIIDSHVAIYHGLYTLIMGGLIPPIIMVICTVSIWHSLKKQNQRQMVISITNRQRKNAKRDQQVVAILLGQVLIYVISAIPFMTNNFYSIFTRSIPNKPVDRVAIENFVGVITEVCVYIFPASTFYCNTLVSRTFRRELFHMFKRLRPQGQRISPNDPSIPHNIMNATRFTLTKIPSTTVNCPIVLSPQ